MWREGRVSVVFPAYNEEANIAASIGEFTATGVVDEIVVVDNNSTDHTAVEVSKTSARLVRETRQGYGYALIRGLWEATGDYIVLAEPDGTFAAKDIFKLLAYADDFDMVCGARTSKEFIWDAANMGWFLRIGNLVVAKLLELLFNTSSLSDCGCTLRLIRREPLARIRDGLSVGGSHFLPQMVILARLHRVRLIEVPVNYRSRIGESKITGSLRGTLKTGLRMIGLILGSWLRHRVVARRELPQVRRPS